MNFKNSRYQYFSMKMKMNLLPDVEKYFAITCFSLKKYRDRQVRPTM